MKFYYPNINKLLILEYYNMTKKFLSVIKLDDKLDDKLNDKPNDKPNDKKMLRFDPNVQIKKINKFDPANSNNNSDSDNNSEDLNNIDETDIIDEDEQEIYDDEQQLSDNPQIIDIMDLFLSKYPHLDNYANKKIIIQLCEMLVSHAPDFSSKPDFYINILESAITQISRPSLNDIINSEIKV